MRKPTHILQLENDKNDTLLIQMMLEREGYVCDMVRVESRAEFVAALMESRFDLILSDMKLPAFDGMEALELARSISPDIPFIIVSGTMGEETAIESLLKGATDYVLKTNMARLVPAVRRALQESQDRFERKRAEQELKKISTLLEQTADSIAITDKNGVIEYVNPGFEKTTGYTRREVTGKTPRILKSGDHEPEFYEMMWHTILSGRVFRAEFRNRRKNGEFYYQEETITPVLDQYGQIAHFVSTGRDISERRKAAEALNESEERFKMLFEFSPDAYYVMDLQGVFIDANRAAEQLFEFSRDELSGKNFFKLGLLPFSDLSKAAGLVAANSMGKPTGPDEFALKSRSGKDRTIEVRTLPMKIQGRPLIVGIARDVTERKQSELALRESEARFRRFFEDAVLGMFRSLPDGKLVAANAQFARIFGYDSAEDALANVSDAAGQLFVDPARHAEVLRLAAGKSGLNRFEIQFKRKGGELFDGTAYLHVERDARGKTIYVEGMIEDASGRHKAEAELREREFWLRESQRVARTGSYVTDFTKGRWASSDELDRIFGIDEGYDRSVAGWLQIVHPDDAEEMSGYLDNLIASRRSFDKDYRIVRRNDGATRWVHGLGELVYDESGSIKTMFGTIQDITERKLAEQELLESEERYRVISDAQFEGIAIHADGIIHDVNDSFCTLFGYQKEDLPGKSIADLLAPEARTAALENIMKTSGGVHEIIGVRADGARIVGEFHSRELTYRGKIVRVTAIHDITVRKQAESVVRSSETRFRSVWEHSADGMRLTDREGRTIAVNDAFCRLVQIPRERLVGELLSVIYRRGGKDDDIGLYLHRFESGNIVPHLSTSVTLWNGDVRELELSNSFIDSGEQGKMILSVFRDITDRRNAERQSSLLAHTLRSAKDCIAVTDRSNRILFVNEAFSTTYGYSEEELLGKDISVVWRSPDLPEHRREVLPATMQEGWHGELTNRRKNGSEFPVEIWTSVVRDESGMPVALVGIARDITERKRFEDQMRQMQKMESIGTLAGGIAHDFNNILGIILGHTTMLSHAPGDPARVKSRAEAIDVAVQRGADLVRQILVFARKSPVRLSPVDINAAIMELVGMLKDTFPRTIDIVLDLDGNIPMPMMDPTQLRQALLNLCVNARDAMVTDESSELACGILTIQTGVISGAQLRNKFVEANAGEYVCIAVADTGVGIDTLTQEKIFEPFFTTKGPGKGTGLGLSVVYGIVRGHEGHIDISSQLHRGTTFRLYLPIPGEPSVDHAPAPVGQGTVSGGHETILLVEDEGELLEMMDFEIRSKGYKVLVARDGIEAVNLFVQSEQRIDLVLSDVGLPELDGLGLLSTLRGFDPRIRFILTSGYLEPSLKQDLTRSGASAFIQKPYQVGDVLRKIREVLDA
jgi:PAS domain S-box-containing protein